MSKMIIHIGPQKCGSTSIQNFLKEIKQFSDQNISYTRFKWKNFGGREAWHRRESLPPQTAYQVTEHLRTCLENNDIVIFSEEGFGNNMLSIRSLCEIASKIFDEVIIIGYARRPSKFLVSYYHQWSFRKGGWIDRTFKELKDLNIATQLFSGLESELIMHCFLDFPRERIPPKREVNLYNWLYYYKLIREIVRGSKAVLKCGLLPQRGSGVSLIEDFCEKAGIVLKEGVHPERSKANTAFPSYFVEATALAISLKEDMPSEHENQLVEFLLPMMQRDRYESLLLTQLSNYIDSYFWSDNQLFCEEYQLDKEYFKPAKLLSKADITEIVQQEQERRLKEPWAIIDQQQEMIVKLTQLTYNLGKELKERS